MGLWINQLIHSFHIPSQEAFVYCHDDDDHHHQGHVPKMSPSYPQVVPKISTKCHIYKVSLGWEKSEKVGIHKNTRICQLILMQKLWYRKRVKKEKRKRGLEAKQRGTSLMLVELPARRWRCQNVQPSQEKENQTIIAFHINWEILQNWWKTKMLKNIKQNTKH